MPEGDAPTFVLATGNSHKVDEVTRILQSLGVQCTIVSMNDACEAANTSVPEIVEDGTTFAENALIKAHAICELTGGTVLAEDSGITVDALNGMPGIFSARWAGSHGDDTANLKLLLNQLTDVPDGRRGAAFECVLAMVTRDEHGEVSEFIAQGSVSGHLLREERGSGGFGYDPIFVPDGYEQTTAEMSNDQKDEVSHRRRALEKLATKLGS